MPPVKRTKAAIVRARQEKVDVLEAKRAVLDMIDQVQREYYNAKLPYFLDQLAKRVKEWEP
jgi:ribosome recycling factor